MDAYPHTYRVSAGGEPEGSIRIGGEGLDDIATDAPPQFGGPEGKWSPETMLVASVADCFILTFRAIAHASRLEWESLECDATGTLDRVDGVTRFTEIQLDARLRLPAGQDRDRADKILHKSDRTCLVTNSLLTEVKLKTEIEVAGDG